MSIADHHHLAWSNELNLGHSDLVEYDSFPAGIILSHHMLSLLFDHVTKIFIIAIS